MADYFVDVEVAASEETLADTAVDRLQEQWPDWEPNDGDLEVILIEALAHMAADAATIAGIMPGEAFQTILEELFGVTRNDGAPASGTVTFQLIDAEAYTIEAGTEVDIDGWAFTVDTDTPTAGSLSKAGVPVTAVETDLASNGLIGEQVAMISASAFIVSVTLDAPTGGAVAPETDEEFRDKGSRQLELQALTLVTGRDYELMALAVAGVDRAVALANQSNRTIVVTGSTSAGTPLPQATKDQLLALYEEYRQTTWTVSMADPTLTTINVTYEVHLYPGYTQAGVLAEANALVAQFLSPPRWGLPQYATGGSTEWVVEPRVRVNKLIDIIGSTHGVDYVASVTITGSAGSVQGNGDWLMPGAVPLPAGVPPGTVTGTVV